MRIAGHCHCGAVGFALEGEALYADWCHCSNCRKWSGAFADPSVLVRIEAILDVAGAEHQRAYSPPGFATRAFCARCGGPAPLPQADRRGIVVPMGMLDGDPGVRPLLHKQVAFKAPWVELTDGLPRYPHWPDPWRPRPPGLDAHAADPPAGGGAVTGSCLCRGVRYAFDGPAEAMRHCHCGRCRRWTGSAFATVAVVPRGGFRVVRGEELLAFAEPPDDGLARGNDRVFCTACGSSVCVGRWREPDAQVKVLAGTLDGDPGVRPACHHHVADKAPWFEITDGLPQYQGDPPAA